MFLSEWREFPLAPCLAEKKKNLMTARVSMLLKSRASLTCFRACFLPGRAKDLSVPRYLLGEFSSTPFSAQLYTFCLITPPEQSLLLSRSSKESTRSCLTYVSRHDIIISRTESLLMRNVKDQALPSTGTLSLGQREYFLLDKI